MFDLIFNLYGAMMAFRDCFPFNYFLNFQKFSLCSVRCSRERLRSHAIGKISQEHLYCKKKKPFEVHTCFVCMLSTVTSVQSVCYCYIYRICFDYHLKCFTYNPYVLSDVIISVENTLESLLFFSQIPGSCCKAVGTCSNSFLTDL